MPLTLETAVYVTEDAAEAEAICDEVLAPNEIEAFVRDRRSHVFPIPAAEGGAFVIVVASAHAADARGHLTQARESGVISPHGELVK